MGSSSAFKALHTIELVTCPSLQLTLQGIAVFPTFTNADLTNATLCHAYFSGGFGQVQSRVVGNGNNPPAGALGDTVVLGGGFAGGRGMIVCGQPGQPACVDVVREPESLVLMLVALCGLALTHTGKSKKTA